MRGNRPSGAARAPPGAARAPSVAFPVGPAGIPGGVPEGLRSTWRGRRGAPARITAAGYAPGGGVMLPIRRRRAAGWRVARRSGSPAAGGTEEGAGRVTGWATPLGGDQVGARRVSGFHHAVSRLSLSLKARSP